MQDDENDGREDSDLGSVTVYDSSDYDDIQQDGEHASADEIQKQEKQELVAQKEQSKLSFDTFMNEFEKNRGENEHISNDINRFRLMKKDLTQSYKDKMATNLSSEGRKEATKTY